MWPHLVNTNFIIWLVAGRPFSGFRLYFTLNGITYFIKFNFRGPSLRISNKTKKLTRNVRPRRFDGNWVFEYYSSINYLISCHDDFCLYLSKLSNQPLLIYFQIFQEMLFFFMSELKAEAISNIHYNLSNKLECLRDTYKLIV